MGGVGVSLHDLHARNGNLRNQPVTNSSQASLHQILKLRAEYKVEMEEARSLR